MNGERALENVNYGKRFFAHVIKDDNEGITKKQDLTDHLINAGLFAGEIGEELGCYHIGLLLGILHDVGKACKSFQGRLYGEHKRQVNHSSAGAVYLYSRIKHNYPELKKKEIGAYLRYSELLFYPLLAHHGLFDTIGKGQITYDMNVGRIQDRMKLSEDMREEYERVTLPYIKNTLEPKLKSRIGLSLDEIIIKALKELLIYVKKSKIVKSVDISDREMAIKIKEKKLYEGYLTRLFLAILKTADCIDSSQWSVSRKITVLRQGELEKIFSDYYRKTEDRAKFFATLKNESPLNKTRVQLSQVSQEHAVLQKSGISQLDMPTGSGKTETALRYAIKNINTFKKSRLIYVAPFLSIVEQSAENIKKVLGGDLVLEHHSNVVNEEEPILDETVNDQALYLPKSYVKDYWDSPVIVTTMVQFYNTLFGAKAANICRYSKLINSTVIIDEIQSLPVEHIYCFNSMLNFLSKFLKVNVILCTATQPPLDLNTIDYPIYLSNRSQVIPKNRTGDQGDIDLSVFNRSQVYPMWSSPDDPAMGSEEFIDQAVRMLNEADSLLCILNTKAAVQLLFDKFSESFPEFKVIYLTTNLCAAHRLELIYIIKEHLLANRLNEKKTKLICVTTSLIEAGVDVDFDLVCRSIAGSDSIEQAQGRCNREGLNIKGGKVFVFRLKEDITDVKGLQDIYQRGEITKSFINKRLERTQNSSGPLNIRKLTEDFYLKYYLENSDKMRLPLPKLGTNAIDLLSTNDRQLNAVHSPHEFQRHHILCQSFDTASKNMHLIDQDTKTVIVPYKNAELISDLLESIDQYNYVEMKDILRKMQRYTVNVPKWKGIREYCSFFSEELDIYILQEERYDEVCGMNIENDEMEAFIF